MNVNRFNALWNKKKFFKNFYYIFNSYNINSFNINYINQFSNILFRTPLLTALITRVQPVIVFTWISWAHPLRSIANRTKSDAGRCIKKNLFEGVNKKEYRWWDEVGNKSLLRKNLRDPKCAFIVKRTFFGFILCLWRSHYSPTV